MTRKRVLLIIGAVALAGFWFALGRPASIGASVDPRDPVTESVPVITRGSVAVVPRNNVDTVNPLQGNVVNAASSAVVGAVVCALASIAERATPPLCTTTDDQGYFVLVPSAASVLITASAPGYRAALRQIADLAAGESISLVLEAGGVSVTGMVLDALGGPIAQASVVARQQDGTASAVARSDVHGRFRFDVPAGQLSVEATAEAYTLQLRTVVAPVANVTFVLTPASTLSGHVEAGGVPVAGALITVNPTSDSWVPPGQARSDARGTFEVSGLVTGEYTVLGEHSDMRSNPVAVQLAVGQPTRGIVVEMSPAASLVGTVRVSHAPCLDGEVHLMGATSKSEPIVDGAVVFRGLVVGHYAVEIACSTGAPYREVLELPLGTTHREWQLATGRELRGTVVDGRGQGVAGASVRLEGAEHSTPDVAETSVASTTSATCIADSAGAFMCHGLAAALYRVSAETASGVETEVVNVDLADTPGELSLRLRPSAAIHISLREESLAAVNSVDDGRSADVRQVLARAQGGAVVAAVESHDGFLFERLALGSYLVFMGNEDDPGSSQRVTLRRDGELVQVSLSPPPLESIQGILLDAEANPVLDTWVRASMSDALLGIYADTGASALTDNEGRFALRGLKPGRYDLSVAAQGSGVAATGVATGAKEIVLRFPELAGAAPRMN